MRLPRSDVVWKNDVLRGRGTDHCREPPQVGRAPIGLAGRADIVAEQKGLETEWGVFAITDSICTRPREGAHGFIVDLGDLDRRESA